MPTSPYTTYAFLMLQLDQGAPNPLDALRPLIIAIFQDNINKVVKTIRIQIEIEKKWGIFVPLSVLRYILDCLTRSSTIEKAGGSNAWIARNTVISDIYEATRKEAEEIYIRVAKAITHQLSIKGNTDTFPEEILQRYLENGAFALLTNDVSPRTPTGKDFLAQAIINAAMDITPGQRDEQFLTDLTSIALGDAIYHAIVGISEAEHIDDAESSISEMKTLSLYLDSRILSAFLGYSSQEEIQAAKELLDMARKIGCQVKCWSHTVREVLLPCQKLGPISSTAR